MIFRCCVTRLPRLCRYSSSRSTGVSATSTVPSEKSRLMAGGELAQEKRETANRLPLFYPMMLRDANRGVSGEKRPPIRSSEYWEGEAPAEPFGVQAERLGGSLALP